MSQNAFAQLNTSSRIAKRAQYEAFEFELAPCGVTVRNCSHADPSDHEYLVTLEDGIPATCECPFDQQRELACKHRVAVAIRTPILEAASERVRADGGQTAQLPDEFDEEQCDCATPTDDLPCWHCIETGRRTLGETDSNSQSNG